MNHNNSHLAARWLCALALLLLAAAPAAALPADVVSMLKRHAAFTDAQIATIQRGDRIVQMLDTGSQAEVAFVGVTKLPISLDTYLDRVRAGTLYRIGDVVLQFGRFAENPALGDMRRLRFESYDVRVSSERNKQVLLSLIREYETSGALGVGPLGEQPKPVAFTRQFEPIAKQAEYLRERMPAAYDYLLRYPNVPKRGEDDFFIWKQMTFGFRPLTRVAQVSVWEDNSRGRREAIVLMKQIYANRYFQVSFQVDHLISDDSDPVHPAVYLVSLNRGSSEFLEGLTGKVIRPIVLSRTQAAAEKTLDQARRDFLAELHSRR
ncbi:MAG TPA: hypothetical protein VER03_01245 [Bryobacteraceae bacterium]|nr:hypothetical protein [Bryobacteraceae bacterium]